MLTHALSFALSFGLPASPHMTFIEPPCSLGIFALNCLADVKDQRPTEECAQYLLGVSKTYYMPFTWKVLPFSRKTPILFSQHTYFSQKTTKSVSFFQRRSRPQQVWRGSRRMNWQRIHRRKLSQHTFRVWVGALALSYFENACPFFVCIQITGAHSDCSLL